MSKYKVIALNVTGVSGIVYYANDKLTADQLGGKDKAEKLVAAGFVEALEVEKKAEPKKSKKENSKKGKQCQ